MLARSAADISPPPGFALPPQAVSCLPEGRGRSLSSRTPGSEIPDLLHGRLQGGTAISAGRRQKRPNLAVEGEQSRLCRAIVFEALTGLFSRNGAKGRKPPAVRNWNRAIPLTAEQPPSRRRCHCPFGRQGRSAFQALWQRVTSPDAIKKPRRGGVFRVIGASGPSTLPAGGISSRTRRRWHRRQW